MFLFDFACHDILRNEPAYACKRNRCEGFPSLFKSLRPHPVPCASSFPVTEVVNKKKKEPCPSTNKNGYIAKKKSKKSNPKIKVLAPV